MNYIHVYRIYVFFKIYMHFNVTKKKSKTHFLHNLEKGIRNSNMFSKLILDFWYCVNFSTAYWSESGEMHNKTISFQQPWKSKLNKYIFLLYNHCLKPCRLYYIQRPAIKNCFLSGRKTIIFSYFHKQQVSR